MTGKTRMWGYSGQVGEWSGDVQIPEDVAATPLAAARFVLERLRPVLEPLHRPARIEVSWGEYDAAGEEVAFHELEERKVVTWGDVEAHVSELRCNSGTPAVNCVFVHLDTCVIGAGGPVWIESSAELQVSFDTPETRPSSGQVAYRTGIDVWLSTTYDENREPRANPEAAHNHPRLEAVLRGLREVTTDYQAGQSQLYPFAIVPTGFREVSMEDLPRRG